MTCAEKGSEILQPTPHIPLQVPYRVLLFMSNSGQFVPKRGRPLKVQTKHPVCVLEGTWYSKDWDEFHVNWLQCKPSTVHEAFELCWPKMNQNAHLVRPAAWVVLKSTDEARAWLKQTTSLRLWRMYVTAHSSLPPTRPPGLMFGAGTGDHSSVPLQEIVDSLHVRQCASVHIDACRLKHRLPHLTVSRNMVLSYSVLSEFCNPQFLAYIATKMPHPDYTAKPNWYQFEHLFQLLTEQLCAADPAYWPAYNPTLNRASLYYHALK